MLRLRTTWEVCMSPLAFLRFTQKKTSGNPYLKICDAPMKKRKIVSPPLTALLGHPVQNIFLAFIKKIFLQTIVKIWLFDCFISVLAD